MYSFTLAFHFIADLSSPCRTLNFTHEHFLHKLFVFLSRRSNHLKIIFSHSFHFISFAQVSMPLLILVIFSHLPIPLLHHAQPFLLDFSFLCITSMTPYSFSAATLHIHASFLQLTFSHHHSYSFSPHLSLF